MAGRVEVERMTTEVVVVSYGEKSNNLLKPYDQHTRFSTYVTTRETRLPDVPSFQGFQASAPLLVLLSLLPQWSSGTQRCIFHHRTACLSSLAHLDIP